MTKSIASLSKTFTMQQMPLRQKPVKVEKEKTKAKKYGRKSKQIFKR